MKAGWIVAILIGLFLWIEAIHPDPRPSPSVYSPPSAGYIASCYQGTGDQCDAYIDRQRP